MIKAGDTIYIAKDDSDRYKRYGYTKKQFLSTPLIVIEVDDPIVFAVFPDYLSIKLPLHKDCIHTKEDIIGGII